MVLYRTSILLDEDEEKANKLHRNEETTGKTKTGKGGLVFRSLNVDRKSKTPYSDATQVRIS